jgi:hypothetical protein
MRFSRVAGSVRGTGIDRITLESREEIDPLLVQRAENTDKISVLVEKIEGRIESEIARV